MSGSRFGFFSSGVIAACLNVAGTVPDSRDILMIVANIGARMSMLPFTSDVGSGSSPLFL